MQHIHEQTIYTKEGYDVHDVLYILSCFLEREATNCCHAESTITRMRECLAFYKCLHHA